MSKTVEFADLYNLLYTGDVAKTIDSLWSVSRDDIMSRRTCRRIANTESLNCYIPRISTSQTTVEDTPVFVAVYDVIFRGPDGYYLPVFDPDSDDSDENITSSPYQAPTHGGKAITYGFVNGVFETQQLSSTAMQPMSSGFLQFEEALQICGGITGLHAREIVLEIDDMPSEIQAAFSRAPVSQDLS